MRLSLRNRVVWLLGTSLVALQLLLGYFFDRALDQAQEERQVALVGAARASVEFAVGAAFRRQSDGLETFAGLAAQQASKIAKDPVKRNGSFLQRLFGTEPEPASSETVRLADRIMGLVEYADASPVIWYLNTDAVPTLDRDLRARVRKLRSAKGGIVRRIQCAGADCLLLSAQPFTTRDGVRTVAVAAESLQDLLAGIGTSAGYQVRIAPPVVTAGAGSDSAGIAIAFGESIAGASLDRPGLQLHFIEERSDGQLAAIRTRYFTIAGAGVLVSLLLVALLLGAPIARVRSLRAALPKLTDGDFQAATSMLQAAQAKAHVRDETTDLIGTAVDITGRLQELQAVLTRQATDLRRQRDQTQLLVDATPAAIVLLEPDGEIVSANRMASSLLQADGLALPGRNLLGFFEDEPRAGFIRLAEEAARGAPLSPQELEIKDANGGRHTVEWQLVPMPEEAGRRVLAVGMDVTRLRETERRLSWLQTHDELTGLLNRRALEKRLATLAGVRSLLLIRPKNESVLHDLLDDAGRDEVQRQIAQQLRAVTAGQAGAEPALVGRFQFAVLVNAPREAVEAGLSRLEGLRRSTSVTVSGKQLELENVVQGIELGETAWRDNVGDQLDALMRMMTGLDGSQAWLTLETLREREQQDYRYWVGEIDAALSSDRLQLYYQPIYDARTLDPTHSEVLVRMIGRDGTVIAPGAFLRAAERSGQMRQIDRVVFGKSIDAILAMQQSGIRHPLSVNMSAQALEQPELWQMVDHAIRARGLQPGRLMLELVETQAIATVDTAAQLMHRYRRQGIHMLLDDFGIGFTSFEYLRELPFEYVKIDQLFVRHLARREDDRKLIRSIHEMVRGLGRKTIAEGVEDAASLRILQKIGIDAVQGFGLARPGPEVNLTRSGLGRED